MGGNQYCEQNKRGVWGRGGGGEGVSNKYNTLVCTISCPRILITTREGEAKKYILYLQVYVA